MMANFRVFQQHHPVKDGEDWVDDVREVGDVQADSSFEAIKKASAWPKFRLGRALAKHPMVVELNDRGKPVPLRIFA